MITNAKEWHLDYSSGSNRLKGEHEKNGKAESHTLFFIP
jgi:hypothetical protein